MEINNRAQEMFPKRLQHLMSTTGTTQQKLADYIGIKRQSVAQYADGTILPTIEKLDRIAEYFHVSADFLLGRTDIESPNVDDIAVHELTGLSKEAIHNLAYCYSRQRDNPITLTVNALIEEGLTLGAISRFLYYDLNNTAGGNLVPYNAKYRYGDPIRSFGYGERVFSTLDADVILEVIDNDMYKRLLIIEIQEKLDRLRKQEDEKEHFSVGGRK